MCRSRHRLYRSVDKPVYWDSGSKVRQTVAKTLPVTYSKAIQTESVSTATDTGDLEASHESQPYANGSGAETADEMRRRILEELEAERRSVENDLRDLQVQEGIKGGPVDDICP